MPLYNSKENKKLKDSVQSEDELLIKSLENIQKEIYEIINSNSFVLIRKIDKSFGVQCEPYLQKAKVSSLNIDLNFMRQHLREGSDLLTNIKTSVAWRLTYPLRYLISIVRGWISCWISFKESIISRKHKSYSFWIKRFGVYKEAHKNLSKYQTNDLESASKFTLFLLVSGLNPFDVIKTFKSIKRQTYSNWELCLIVDRNPLYSLLSRCIKKYFMKGVNRIFIKVLPVNIQPQNCKNNADFADIKGDWVAFLRSGDLISLDALFLVANSILKDPSSVIVYADEDELTRFWGRKNPIFKVDWDPILFLSHDYLGSLPFFKRSIFESFGSIYDGCSAESRYFMISNIVTSTPFNKVLHIPRICSHHLNKKSKLICRPLEDKQKFINQIKVNGEKFLGSKVLNVEFSCIHDLAYSKIKFALPDPAPLVSVLIPTKDKVDILKKCIDSLQNKTTYLNYEILVIDNGSVEPISFEYFAEIKASNLIVLRSDAPFNFSSLNNMASRKASGDYLCLLNNDVEIITPDWIERMLAFASQEGVGCVGAKLWYPDGRLQHGGIILGIGGVAGHAYKYIHQKDSKSILRLTVPHAVSAVTGACLMISKKKYQKLEGLKEELAVAFNDVDFCLRAKSIGLINVMNPEVELIHHESISRGSDKDLANQLRYEYEFNYMQKVWSSKLQSDPYYNPNLTLLKEDLSLAWPPRLEE